MTQTLETLQADIIDLNKKLESKLSLMEAELRNMRNALDLDTERYRSWCKRFDTLGGYESDSGDDSSDSDSDYEDAGQKSPLISKSLDEENMIGSIYLSE